MADEPSTTYSVANPRHDLSFEWVSARYTYDPATGFIASRKQGRRVGFNHSTGYRHIYLAGVHRKEHRVAWLLAYGEWPDGLIDHINGNRSDNRIDNLRLCTGSQNQANRGKQKNNSTGFKGVTKTADGRYRARVGVGGSSKVAGYFDTAEQAHRAYAEALSALYSEFAKTS